MPDPRRRTPQTALGLDRVRTDAGTVAGGGIGPSISRMAAAMRNGAQNASAKAGKVPVGSVISETEAIEEGTPLVLDLPTGHLWSVSVRGSWFAVTAGANGLFLGIISWTPTGFGQKQLNTMLHPDRPEQYVEFTTLGPCTINARARSTDAITTPLTGANLQAGIEAVWLRAAIGTDPS